MKSSGSLSVLHQGQQSPGPGQTQERLLSAKALKITANSTEKSDYTLNLWQPEFREMNVAVGYTAAMVRSMLVCLGGFP